MTLSAIAGGTVATPQGLRRANVLIKDGKIAAIAGGIAPGSSSTRPAVTSCPAAWIRTAT